MIDSEVVLQRAWLIALALCASGCVIGRPARPSSSQSAQGPSGAAVTVQGSPVLPNSAPRADDEPEPATRTPPTPSSLWVRGYWHWDGVDYVWQRGHWEEPNVRTPGP